ncbi:MAG: hypothetical protein PSX80_04530 [bacterium]|nr:hypothetical protein [bacterium]
MAIILSSLGAALISAQAIDILDNQKIVDLVKSGFGDDVLIGKIHQSRVLLDASTNGLMQLKEAGVSDAVIVQLLERARLDGFAANGPLNEYRVIPYGTELKVLVREKLSSRKLTVGQKLTLEVAEDLTVNNTIVVSKGTPVAAVVVDSRKSGMMGRSGRLAISIRSTTINNGESLRLRAGKGGKDGDNMGSMFALTVIFGAPGLLIKGTNGQIPANSIVVALVDETKYVKTVPVRP